VKSEDFTEVFSPSPQHLRPSTQPLPRTTLQIYSNRPIQNAISPQPTTSMVYCGENKK